jgi:hypothetical protein
MPRRLRVAYGSFLRDQYIGHVKLSSLSRSSSSTSVSACNIFHSSNHSHSHSTSIVEPRSGQGFPSSINIVHIARSGNSSHTFNVNSNNTYTTSDSDESDAEDTQSASLPRSSIPRSATNFENDHRRWSEPGYRSSGPSTIHAPRFPPRPGNLGDPPEIPGPNIPPVIARLSSLHETILSVTGPLQTTTANLESITRELVTMNNTLKDIATALNKLATPEVEQYPRYPSPQRTGSILSTGYEPPNIDQNDQGEYPLHPLPSLPLHLVSSVPEGSGFRNEEAVYHGYRTTQQGLPSGRVGFIHHELPNINQNAQGEHPLRPPPPLSRHLVSSFPEGSGSRKLE